ncbi:39S ribosomal protein L13, mitochondrial [Melanaphis sacchari]|uniref:39S ribosomal protein L13, mitochondrial n=1 Tax=Melanaphis sacchari TaxID=742174 RepID=A0A2H8TPU4_9HEMI|nr:39S ribosomal protein L13, mitochondrial [Melanaphis sacchari]
MSQLGRVKQWNTFARCWHLFDAAWQNPLECAPTIEKYLKGLTKPIYHPLVDCGDHVVVINSKQIAFPGEEWRRRAYFHHTGYSGGASWTPAWELHDRDPTMIFRKAVYHHMKGNLFRRVVMERLHIYPDSNVPEEVMENISNQIRSLRSIPKTLDSYSKDEIEKYPKIIDYPEDYILSKN